MPRLSKSGTEILWVVYTCFTHNVNLIQHFQPATNFVSITPATDLNDIHHVPGSGLLLCANEGIQMSSFFVPQLGPAPKWCSFLENITEEMEDTTTRTAYEDYKFVERAELAKLGLDHLVGTPALKPYMHGYFLSLQLYDTARLIANPFAYEEHREKLVQQKVDALAESRIRMRKNATPSVKVNKALAERVQREAERTARREEKRRERKRTNAEESAEPMDVDGDEETEPTASSKPSLLSDPRFSALFENPEFEVDEGSREFMLMNPSVAAQQMSGQEGTSRERRARTAVEDEEEESNKSSSDGLGEDSESEDEDRSADSDDSDIAGGE
jgi:ribosome biogenesis protein ENP2